MKTPRVYLDNNASTRVAPEVVEAMVRVLRDTYGNASSIHREGQAARRLCDEGRESLAEALNCRPMEIVFTSGGTEANNHALRGVARAFRDKGRHIVTSAIEHHSVLNVCQDLEKEGFETTYLPVDGFGRVSVDDLASAIRKDTILISLMHANNEVGTTQPIIQVGRIARERGILFHCDAMQAGARVPLDVEKLGVDLLSLSAHKLHGPKGVGLLYLREGVEISPLLAGGSHERARRAGTENLAGIVGFSKAMELVRETMVEDAAEMEKLRDRAQGRIEEKFPRVLVQRHRTHCLCNTLHLCFPDVESEALLMNLDLAGIAASSGSACTSGSVEPSHVLAAMGVPESHIRGALRISLARETTAQEIDYFLEALEDTMERLQCSPD